MFKIKEGLFFPNISCIHIYNWGKRSNEFVMKPYSWIYMQVHIFDSIKDPFRCRYFNVFTMGCKDNAAGQCEKCIFYGGNYNKITLRKFVYKLIIQEKHHKKTL